jgi:hypothetical protein
LLGCPLVAGRWSLVAGRWSLVAGRWSLVAGRLNIMGIEGIEKKSSES